jgi:uncharacterized protein involved in response to NO
MNNDKKTTILGVVQFVIAIALSAAVYFFQLPADVAESLKQAVASSQDWIALAIALIGGLGSVISFFTNKKDTTTKTT